MPELPEVTGLVEFLGSHLVGSVITAVEVGSLAVVKTYDPPPDALRGLTVHQVRRHGKFIDLNVDDVHLIFHLAKAGWVRWYDTMPKAPLRLGKGPALRVRATTPHAGEPASAPGFDLTEAGTKKRLAVYIVTDPQQVPGIARLGPDPLAPDFDTDALRNVIRQARNQQIKGLLRDQMIIAGIGNAYSDEILHAAHMSPFAMSGSLTEEQIENLSTSLHTVLTAAVAEAAGRPASELKDAKRRGMAVHAQTGKSCPVCGDTVREVSFATTFLNYCATCQTGGKPLADRRMSRLIK